MKENDPLWEAHLLANDALREAYRVGFHEGYTAGYVKAMEDSQKIVKDRFEAALREKANEHPV